MFGGGFQFSGVTFFSAPAPPPPAADNGLSRDAVTGSYILGNNVGTPGNPGMFLAEKVSELNSFVWNITDTGNGTTYIIDPGGQIITLATNSQLRSDGINSAYTILHTGLGFDPGGFTLFDDNFLTGIKLTMVSGVPLISITNDTEQYRFVTGNKFIVGTAADDGAILQVDGDITTSDPGGGKGKWQLGQVTAGVSVLDATRFVEVQIDGAVIKLAVIL